MKQLGWLALHSFPSFPFFISQKKKQKLSLRTVKEWIRKLQLEVKIRNRLTHKASKEVNNTCCTGGFVWNQAICLHKWIWFLLVLVRTTYRSYIHACMKMYGLYILDTNASLCHQCMFQRNTLWVIDLYINSQIGHLSKWRFLNTVTVVAYHLVNW